MVKAKCYITHRNDPYLYLHPVKMEVVTKQPLKLYLFHDVLTPSQVLNIKSYMELMVIILTIFLSVFIMNQHISYQWYGIVFSWLSINIFRNKKISRICTTTITVLLFTGYWLLPWLRQKYPKLLDWNMELRPALAWRSFRLAYL